MEPFYVEYMAYPNDGDEARHPAFRQLERFD